MVNFVTIDKKGRILIPASERRRRGIRPKDRFMVGGDGMTIILKYMPEEPKPKPEPETVESPEKVEEEPPYYDADETTCVDG